MTPPPIAGQTARLRVGYVMTHYPRVAQTFISGEIDAVERAGVTVRPFAMNAPGPADQLPPGALKRIEKTMYLKKRWARALFALIRQAIRHPAGTGRVTRMALASAGGSPERMMRRMAHLVQAALVADTSRREELKYLHAHFGLAPTTIAWLASALASVDGRQLPFGFTIHGFHDFVDPAESRLDLKARAAAQVFCVSDFTRSQLCCITDPALWSHFILVRCGIDLSAFAQRGTSPVNDTLDILTIGRLSPEKGHGILLEALSSLKSEGTPLRLVIIGDGPLRSSLEVQAKRVGVADLVEFTGELSPAEVRAHLGTADLFCLPSFSEGLPISIMEAMAIGVPVVTTWIAGIPELAEAEVTALTVPPARADALAAALHRLAHDRGLRMQLTNSARRKVEHQHDQSQWGRFIAERFVQAASQ